MNREISEVLEKIDQLLIQLTTLKKEQEHTDVLERIDQILIRIKEYKSGLKKQEQDNN